MKLQGSGRTGGPARPARRIAVLLVRILRVISGVALMAMMCVTVLDVVGRHFFASPIAGVVDIVEVSLVWCVFIGIAVAFAVGAHITVDLIDTVISPRALRVLTILNGLVAAAVVAMLARLAMIEFLDKLDWGDSSIDLNIPLTWHWGAIVVGYAASSIIILLRLSGIKVVHDETEP